MLKFNNTHIFTGYLKQLLSSFNLPACKIYTREFADYLAKHGKEDPRVIESFDTMTHYLNKEDGIGKKRIAYRLNYLKNNELCHYYWQYMQDKEDLGRSKSIWRPNASIFYDKDKFIPGLSRRLNSQSGIYDTATHEYLGDYLRFLRDYHDVNLMSLYNCFNNNICNNMYYDLNGLLFDSRDARYRIYALPVKLFQDYTIAIDCEQEVEMFCGIYGTSLDFSKAEAMVNKTYKKVNRPLFKQPFLYDKLNVKYWGFEQDGSISPDSYPTLIDGKKLTRWDIAHREQDLKLFIKVPSSCKSSIVILEGDYRGFNDFKYLPVVLDKDGKIITNPESMTDDEKKTATFSWQYRQNHSMVNFAPEILSQGKRIKQDLNEIVFTPIGKLQLLALNTCESYPFADRLIEYISGSATTAIDEIPDNIKRAQEVMTQNNHYFKIAGLWENKMQKVIYDYMMNSGPIELDKNEDDTIKFSSDGKSIKLIDRRLGYHRSIGHTSKSMLFDVLGYVDKDAEKWYASWTTDCDNKADLEKVKNGSKKPVVIVKDSIQNVDIYNGLFDI